MRLWFTLIVGVAIGAGAVWFFLESQSGPDHHSQNAARSVPGTIEEELRKLNLRSPDISNEMARTGRVMRQKAQEAGQALADATADARVTAAIKTKFVRDPGLSVWNISVDTTEGVVTLAGKVSSAKDVGTAVLLAMQTEGVREVISTLQVKP
jgi:hyperosmotically inducible protein